MLWIKQLPKWRWVKHTLKGRKQPTRTAKKRKTTKLVEEINRTGRTEPWQDLIKLLRTEKMEIYAPTGVKGFLKLSLSLSLQTKDQDITCTLKLISIIPYLISTLKYHQLHLIQKYSQICLISNYLVFSRIAFWFIID